MFHWRLGRLYRRMGPERRSQVEFDKASSITKTVDSALVDKVQRRSPHAKTGPQQAGGSRKE